VTIEMNIVLAAVLTELFLLLCC